MTATPLTLDEGTELRPVVAPESTDVLPSRRRQREHERSSDAENRIPALAALDAAAEFVLVVRTEEGFRVFSEGGLVAQDADGREVHGGTEGQEVEGLLPILVGRHDDGEEQVVPDGAVSVLSALEATEDEDLLESLLELGSTPEPVVEEGPIAQSLDTDELGETNRVPGLVRGSSGTGETADEEPEADVALALVLEDGRRIPVDHTVLLGRSPSARADDETAEQIALEPTLTDISRNHLEIRLDGETVVARDLASTNGTVLTRAGQAPRLVPTDEAIRLLPGDSLNLGGSAVVEVEALQ